MTADREWSVSPELGQRLVLRRVARGTVYERDGAYFSGGRFVPSLLMPHMATLIDSGHLRHVTSQHLDGSALRVELTTAGIERLSTLDHSSPPQANPDTGDTRPPTKGPRMSWHWTLPALLAVYAVRIVVNHFDRPTRCSNRVRVTEHAPSSPTTPVRRKASAEMQ